MNPEATPQTSLMAYRSISPEWRAKGKELVYLALLDGPATREEITRRIGKISKDSVNGRVNDLLREGYIEVCGYGLVNSGNLAEVLAIREQ